MSIITNNSRVIIIYNFPRCLTEFTGRVYKYTAGISAIIKTNGIINPMIIAAIVIILTIR